MHAIDLVTGLDLEFMVESFQQGMVDILCGAAGTADQVVVVTTSNLVDKLTIAYMSCQNQALLKEKVQCAVNSGFGDAGHGLLCLAADFQRRQVTLGALEDVQDDQALRGHAEAL